MTKEDPPAGQGGAPSALQLSPIQRARAEAVVQSLRGDGPGSLNAPLWLDGQCYEEFQICGLRRRDVDEALNDLADASIVTLRCKSGVVVVDLVRQQK